MTPPELLLASLGSCAAYYAVDYLKRNQLSQQGCKVRVTADKVKNPFRLDNFQIQVEVDELLNSEQLKGVEDAVRRCLIHKTVEQSPSINVDIRPAVAA
jgi:uncharacterized OsmC-like protein